MKPTCWKGAHRGIRAGLFLANLRAGLIVASVIPLSMLFAVILMERLERGYQHSLERLPNSIWNK